MKKIWSIEALGRLKAGKDDLDKAKQAFDVSSAKKLGSGLRWDRRSKILHFPDTIKKT